MLLVIAEYVMDPFGLGIINLGVSLTILIALGITAYAIYLRAKAECLNQLAEQATQRFESLSQNMNIALFEQNLSTNKSWGNELFTTLFPQLNSEESDKLNKLLQLIEPKRSSEILSAIDELNVDDPAITENFTIPSTMQADTLWLEGRFRKQLKQSETYLSVALIDKTAEVKTQLELESIEASLINNKHKLADLDYLLSVTAKRSATDILSLDLLTGKVRFVYGGKTIGFPYEESSLETLNSAVMPSYRHYLKALTDGSSSPFELSILGEGKITYWWSITPLKTDPNNITVNLFIREITKEKLANDRIRQARQDAETAIRKLNVTADTANIGLLDIDPVTQEIRPSPTLREMLDLPHVDKLPMHFLVDSFEGASNQRLSEVLVNLSLFTGPERFELSMVSNNVRRHFVLNLSSQGLLSSDRKVLGSLLETTEYIQLQEKLSEALNNSQKALHDLEIRYHKEKELFGFISHEIRTPVSAIRMMLEDNKDHKTELLETTDALEKLIDGLKSIVERGDVDRELAREDQSTTDTGNGSISNSTPINTATFELADNQVLLAEDTPTIRMLSAKLIESQGASVAAAEDGEKALEIALNKDFDLVITDIFMPNMDGYELTRSLRENGFTGPIIGVTAATIGEERDELIAAGANAAIGKPLTKEKLLDTLATLYDHTEQIDS
jgi:CheY-like chemotaxis protein